MVSCGTFGPVSHSCTKGPQKSHSTLASENVVNENSILPRVSYSQNSVKKEKTDTVCEGSSESEW